MAFDRKTLVIPDNTKFEELTIVTNGDVVIGDRCLINLVLKLMVEFLLESML